MSGHGDIEMGEEGGIGEGRRVQPSRNAKENTKKRIEAEKAEKEAKKAVLAIEKARKAAENAEKAIKKAQRAETAAATSAATGELARLYVAPPSFSMASSAPVNEGRRANILAGIARHEAYKSQGQALINEAKAVLKTAGITPELRKRAKNQYNLGKSYISLSDIALNKYRKNLGGLGGKRKTHRHRRSIHRRRKTHRRKTYRR